MNEQYHPEPYWSEVAERIKSRTGKNVIAGDDEPYYRYKRHKFLSLLRAVPFTGKSVLEIGCGPGGNLAEIWKLQPARLEAVDISDNMVKLATANNHKDVKIHKIDGTSLPFPDNTFDIVFTATVLQHNTDEAMLKKIISEICRVSKNKVYFFERIESDIIGDDLCLGRPVTYYENFCRKNGLALQSVKYINIRTSYYMAGAIRKLLNPKTRVEGEPLNALSIALEKVLLPITKILDTIFTSKKDIARMEFTKDN